MNYEKLVKLGQSNGFPVLVTSRIINSTSSLEEAGAVIILAAVSYLDPFRIIKSIREMEEKNGRENMAVLTRAAENFSGLKLLPVKQSKVDVARLEKSLSKYPFDK